MNSFPKYILYLLFILNIYAQPIPNSQLSVTTADVVVNQKIQIQAILSNLGNAVGFGPFIDFLVPPGISLQNELITNTMPFVYTFITNPCVQHPRIPEQVCASDGYTFFSYYAGNQSVAPNSTIQFSIPAEVNPTAIPASTILVESRGGFTSQAGQNTSSVQNFTQTLTPQNINFTIGFENVQLHNTKNGDTFTASWALSFSRFNRPYDGKIDITLPCGVHIQNFNQTEASTYNLQYSPATPQSTNITVSFSAMPDQLLSEFTFGFTYTYDNKDASGNICPKFSGNNSEALNMEPFNYTLSYYFLGTCNCTEYRQSPGSALASMPIPNYTASGCVFLDNNGNGIDQDTGDQFLPGITVELLDDKNNVMNSSQTDSNGCYLFPNLPTNSYTVTLDFVQNNVTGYTLSPSNQGTDITKNSKATPTSPTLASIPFTIVNESAQYLNFGLVPPPVLSIEGCIWVDSNRNGIMDISESQPPNSVTLQLSSSSGQISTTSDSQGCYTFGNLTSGNYTVSLDLASNNLENYNFTLANQGTDVTMNSKAVPTSATSGAIQVTIVNQPSKYNNFGIYPTTFSVSGCIWYDSNNNGVHDSSEKGASGIPVSIMDMNNNTIATNQTDSNGCFVFPAIPCDNTYVISTSTSTTPITVGNGAVSDVSIGLQSPLYSISGCDWVDVNVNGIMETTESRIPDVEMDLVDNSGHVVGSTQTNQQGCYLFGNLTSGNYSVQLDFAKNNITFVLTLANQGTDVTVNSKATLISPKLASAPANVVNQSVEYVNFGIYQYIPAPPCYNISGCIWYDVNKNGIMDTNEQAAPGLSVVLTVNSSNSVTLNMTKTDNMGCYLFINVTEYELASYKVTLDFAENNITNYGLSPKNQGTDVTKNSKATLTSPTLATIDFAFTNGSVYNLNFGLTPPQSSLNVSGCVWKDMNNNGIKDNNEAPFPNVVLILSTSSSSSSSGSQPMATTSSNGCYVFTEVPPGNHQVQLSWANNSYLDEYKLSPPLQGGNGDINSKGQIVTSALAEAPVLLTNESVYDVNFGLSPTSCPLVGDDTSHPCGAYSPFNITFSAGGSNEFCVYVTTTHGVTVSQMDYISFKGISVYGPVNAGTVTDQNGDSTSSCWVENYTSGNVCAKQGSCQGFSSSNCEPNDVNLCMHCDSNSYMMTPVQACFTITSQKQLQLEDFVGAQVKVGARGLNGYCATSAQVVSTLCEQSC